MFALLFVSADHVLMEALLLFMLLRFTPSSDADFLRSDIVLNAMNFLGTDYHFSGTESSSGFDCSGFAGFIYSRCGIQLPRQSAQQYAKGTPVDKNRALPGDLVFFKINGRDISHVGIYIGRNNFIHAPSTGKKVCIESIESDYWQKRFAGFSSYISGGTEHDGQKETETTEAR